jgi:hypothetical protein
MLGPHTDARPLGEAVLDDEKAFRDPEFVAADQPWDSVGVQHRDAIAAWRALIE